MVDTTQAPTTGNATKGNQKLIVNCKHSDLPQDGNQLKGLGDKGEEREVNF